MMLPLPAIHQRRVLAPARRFLLRRAIAQGLAQLDRAPRHQAELLGVIGVSRSEIGQLARALEARLIEAR